MHTLSTVHVPDLHMTYTGGGAGQKEGSGQEGVGQGERVVQGRGRGKRRATYIFGGYS